MSSRDVLCLVYVHSSSWVVSCGTTTAGRMHPKPKTWANAKSQAHPFSTKTSLISTGERCCRNVFRCISNFLPNMPRILGSLWWLLVDGYKGYSAIIHQCRVDGSSTLGVTTPEGIWKGMCLLHFDISANSWLFVHKGICTTRWLAKARSRGFITLARPLTNLSCPHKTREPIFVAFRTILVFEEKRSYSLGVQHSVLTIFS